MATPGHSNAKQRLRILMPVVRGLGHAWRLGRFAISGTALALGSDVFAAGLLAVEQRFHAIEGPAVATLEFYRSPAAPRMDSVRIRVRLSPHWRYGNLALVWESGAPWSEKTPSLEREGEQVCITARRAPGSRRTGERQQELVTALVLEAWAAKALGQDPGSAPHLWMSLEYTVFPGKNLYLVTPGELESALPVFARPPLPDSHGRAGTAMFPDRMAVSGRITTDALGRRRQPGGTVTWNAPLAADFSLR